MLTLIFLAGLIALPLNAFGSTIMDSIGTGSAGSYDHSSPQKEEGSKSKGVTPGKEEHKKYFLNKSEGSKNRGYGYREKAGPGFKNAHPKKEGSKGKSYSRHGKSGHGHGGYGKGHHGGYGKGHNRGHGKYGGYGRHEGSGAGRKHHASKHHGYKKHDGSHGKSYGKGFDHGAYGNKHKGHKHDPFRHLLRYKDKLGLTKGQLRQIRKMQFDYKKDSILAKADHKISHMELDREVHSGQVNETRIREIARDMAAIKSSMILSMADYKIKLLKLLTPHQRMMVTEMHGD